MQLVGKVLWWDGRDREGVIVDSNGREVYFNSSVFPDFNKHKNIEGKFVWFTLNKSVPHLTCAKSVSTVPSSSVSKAKQTFERSNKRGSPSVAA
jgi:hypothetical protein